jgi:hypothetical protein
MKEILHKHYDDEMLKSYLNKDLLYLYSFFYSNQWIEISEWKKIEREILQRMSGIPLPEGNEVLGVLDIKTGEYKENL